ncbi:hypothetical protein PR003_g12826 [Phytophthora rubi]|uniref:glyceraldehyde-3-phosphate dehydrogenase (phosphorylating) n=1 Tax=Phytophthora rubi TaxID=129364 RepID=A0A6A4F3V3_9STRA|nr:hypothetical protein PR003_g12826 [Phytophthora rubi]
MRMREAQRFRQWSSESSSTRARCNLNGGAGSSAFAVLMGESVTGLHPITQQIKKGLAVIACIGETKELREANQTAAYITEQLDAYATEISDWPIWAIGTARPTRPRRALSQKADIDGFLVGGASLKPDFLQIINAQNPTTNVGSAVDVAINGFGRIGRLVLRAAAKNPLINVAAINDPFISTTYMEYMLEYDTMHGKFDGTLSHDEQYIFVNGMPIHVFNEMNPINIKWGGEQVRYVVESTGAFTTTEKASTHLQNGVEKVVISAPSSDALMFVMGVNHELYEYTYNYHHHPYIVCSFVHLGMFLLTPLYYNFFGSLPLHPNLPLRSANHGSSFVISIHTC